MELRISYKTGEYTTTFYSEGKLLNVFTTQYDPLEPGVLREIYKISDNSVASSVSTNSPLSTFVSRFWWDGVRYICGTNIDMPFARPCHNHHNIDTHDNRLIQGTRMQHFQLSRGISQSILTLSPALMGAAIGVILGTKIPGIGNVIGGMIGLAIGIFAEHLLVRRNLECDRGNIWIVVHRCLSLTLIPTIPPTITLLPRFFRLGRLNIWDNCPHIVPIPAWRDS